MPDLYLIAGCNGAGKTTAATVLLPEVLGIQHFVNADQIAAELSPENPEAVAIQAGRLMLQRVDELLAEGADFALETTLATRSYTGLVRRARAVGYDAVLVYFWLESPELAIRRVARRVREGGHFIPDDVVRRRYALGLKNLRELFLPLVDEWLVCENNGELPTFVAEKRRGQPEPVILNETIWQKIIRYETDAEI
jgi:predicted ABC-type ATPase